MSFSKNTVPMDEIRRADESDVDVVQPVQDVSKKWMIFRMVVSSLGCFAGFLVMFTFIYPYKFWNTVAFGGVSGVVAGVLLYVHVRWYRRSWQRQKNAEKKLTALMLVGCFSQLLGICGMSVYTTMAIMLGQNLVLENGKDNYWMALTWSFMTLKWGAALFWYTRSYRHKIKHMEDGQRLAVS